MDENSQKNDKISPSVKIAIAAMLIALISVAIFWTVKSDSFNTAEKANEIPVEISEQDFDKIENGIHVATGFVEDEGMQLVIQNCTSCHSAKLVTQNRLSKEGWQATIKWMQETQNLWPLGPNEEKIIDYLAKNYGPVSKGRRQNLQNIEWYDLE